MDAWIPIVVGLGSALLGVVGGHFGTVRIETQRMHRMRIGIVKAMLGELRGNAAAATEVLYNGPRLQMMTYSKETWAAANFELAQFVGNDLYRKLLLVYDLLPVVQTISESSSDTWPNTAVVEPLDQWVQRIKGVMNDLLQLPEAVTFRSSWRTIPPDEDVRDLPARGRGPTNSDERWVI